MSNRRSDLISFVVLLVWRVLFFRLEATRSNGSRCGDAQHVDTMLFRHGDSVASDVRSEGVGRLE